MFVCTKVPISIVDMPRFFVRRGTLGSLSLFKKTWYDTVLLTYWIQRQWVAFPKLIVVQNFPNSHFLKHNIIWKMLPLSNTMIFALASSLILVKSNGMSKYPLCISLLSIFMWLTTSERLRVIYKLNQDVFLWLVQKKNVALLTSS